MQIVRSEHVIRFSQPALSEATSGRCAGGGHGGYAGGLHSGGESVREIDPGTTRRSRPGLCESGRCEQLPVGPCRSERICRRAAGIRDDQWDPACAGTESGDQTECGCEVDEFVSVQFSGREVKTWVAGHSA